MVIGSLSRFALANPKSNKPPTPVTSGIVTAPSRLTEPTQQQLEFPWAQDHGERDKRQHQGDREMGG